MKVFLKFIFLVGVIGLTAYLIKNNLVEMKKINLSNFKLAANIFVVDKQASVSGQFADWTEEQVLEQINSFRTENKLKKLVLSEKLTQAAKARLASIIVYKDVNGESTGLERTTATKMSGYNYGWIGDLILMDNFKINSPIEYWKRIENANSTLLEKNFKDIGIAIQQTEETVSVYAILASPALKAVTPSQSVSPKISWGGIELWKAVNKRREEMGVNPLKQKDELCTIAAIRLNQILALGKLDNHLGFETALSRDDLKWVQEKYDISEFLVEGYETPELAVKAWENTLGHKKLLAGGEYVWGCVYAQNTFGVAIAAY